MSPGEIKGYARQAMKRKQLTAEEKTAISLLLDALEAMLAIAPVIQEINREIKSDKNKTIDDKALADPNTGWNGKG